MLNAILTVLSQMTVNLPVGTNLGLLHLLWMLMNGALLSNRGALFPALKAVGLSDEATRRAWTAFRSGQWQITDLLVVWRSYVKGRSDWQEHRYEGYLPVPADITAFWRPKLKKCPSQPYHPVAKRALPAVIFAVVGDVGHLNGQLTRQPGVGALCHLHAGRAIARYDHEAVRLERHKLAHARVDIDIAFADEGDQIARMSMMTQLFDHVFEQGLRVGAGDPGLKQVVGMTAVEGHARPRRRDIRHVHPAADGPAHIVARALRIFGVDQRSTMS